MISGSFQPVPDDSRRTSPFDSAVVQFDVGASHSRGFGDLHGMQNATLSRGGLQAHEGSRGRNDDPFAFGDSPIQRSRKRADTEMSFMSVWDADEEDPTISRFRGLVFLITLLICLILFAIGCMVPLVHVIAFPDSSMETSIRKTLLDVIFEKYAKAVLKKDPSLYGAAFVTGAASVGVPVLMMLGTLLLVFDNFFAKGFGWNGCLGSKARNAIIAGMCTICSYEVVCSFLVLLVMGFFTTGITVIDLEAGFYCNCLYCLLSIGMMQAMEALKEPPEEEIDEDMDMMKMGTMASVKIGMRRRLSSYFPELPGFERVVDVDTCQVFLLLVFFLASSCTAVFQPMLELHITMEGLTFERKLLTLYDVLDTARKAENILVFVVFILLVFINPFLYGLLILIAGVANLSCWKSCLREPPARLYDGAVWLALLLKPWVMTDVFAVALGLFIMSMQDAKFMSTTIPNGVFPPPLTDDGSMPHGMKFQFLSGIYLLVGCGTSVFFLRFFWSKTNDVAQQPESEYGHVETMARSASEMNYPQAQPSKPCCQCPFGLGRFKACWSVLVWILLCLGMSGMPLPLKPFQLTHTNSVLNGTMPMLNQMIKKSLPNALGSCNSTDVVPMPCQEAGMLYHAMQGSQRISMVWVSGLNTLKLTQIDMKKERAKVDDGEDRLLTMAEFDFSSARHLQGQDNSDESLSAKLAALKAQEEQLKAKLGHSKDSARSSSDARPSAAAVHPQNAGQGSEQSSNNAGHSAAAAHSQNAGGPAGWGSQMPADALAPSNGANAAKPKAAPTRTATSAPTAPPEAHTTHPTIVTAAPVTTAEPTLPPGPVQYKIGVSGQFEQLHLFLKVEMCDDDKGNGCKVFLATNSSCCQPDRSFRLEISFRCNSGGEPDIDVSGFELDSLVIDASASLLSAARQQQGMHMTAELPAQDITGKVKAAVKSQLTDLLTKKNLLKWGQKQLNFQQLLGRVLRFSAHDALFEC